MQKCIERLKNSYSETTIISVSSCFSLDFNQFNFVFISWQVIFTHIQNSKCLKISFFLTALSSSHPNSSLGIATVINLSDFSETVYTHRHVHMNFPLTCRILLILLSTCQQILANILALCCLVALYSQESLRRYNVSWSVVRGRAETHSSVSKSICWRVLGGLWTYQESKSKIYTTGSKAQPGIR